MPFSNTTNFLGTFLQCNNDLNQPYITILGNKIPVGCTGALAQTFNPNAQGTASTTLNAIEGTVGPSGTGTLPCTAGGAAVCDSAGNPPNVDAAKYPCPPTAAQLALSPPDSCVFAIGDVGGDRIVVPIAFNLLLPVVAPVVPTTVAPGTSPGGGATTTPAATKASSGSLAFTGSGPGLWWLALVGMILIVFGGVLLAVVDQPRRLLRLVLHRARRES